LARLVLAFVLVLIVGGIVWHGVSVGVMARLWHDLIDRPDGPMRFRFILQPLMAALAAFHDGRKDARRGRAPYLVSMLRDPARRAALLREGLNSTARIILLGLVMDALYQAVVLRTFYPNEAVIIALLLAFVPYVLIRGPVRRAFHRRAAAGHAS
ncbi:MAG: hypothetical protein ACREF3_14450, partial [Acetobacteraceae bacterium]